MIKIKRAYEPTYKQDGYRILVDRLWPRGIRKSDLAVNEWAKELAPSAELRKNFGHDPGKWKEFRSQYQLELRRPEAREKIRSLADRASETPITLVYSARDTEHNNAIVLKEVLEKATRGLKKHPRNAA